MIISSLINDVTFHFQRFVSFHERENVTYAVKFINESCVFRVFVQVCQHPNARMREWGAEAITSLIKAGLSYKHEPPLSHNQVIIHPADLRTALKDL